MSVEQWAALTLASVGVIFALQRDRALQLIAWGMITAAVALALI
ncbi:hypothetical protein [Paracraurococcus ruber]|nr:hypothetical protein [Paracraurococcus ruber]